MRPSSGSRTAVATPASRATVSARAGEASVSEKTVVAPRRAHLVDQSLDLPRAGLGLRLQADERDLHEAVPGREIPERRVARDDLTARAPGETPTVLVVERIEPRDEVVGRGRRPERRRDLPRDGCEADGIEPHVRIASPTGRRRCASTSTDGPLRPSTACCTAGWNPSPA